ncbi:MAG: xanthine dehydrogenase family protein [Anaerolineae bacterium]|nr:xanthine dehydrogenase family protein [Anaerolineae bacterium]
MSEPNPNLTYVGKPARNVDGIDKAMGRARYVADMRVPGMLHAAALYSTQPHARIVALDVGPALAMPGVAAAVTAGDFVDQGRWGWPIKDTHMLAFERVRCVGDAIAAVAAETREQARQAVRAIKLELEALPGVFDPAEALEPGAPPIPEKPSEHGAHAGKWNLAETLIVRNGDPDLILDECDIVLDETYTFGHQEHAYLETEAALAIPHADGSLTVYNNCQSPFIARGHLVTVLGLPEDKIQVIQAAVGGGFGGKDDAVYKISGQAAALALKTGRPVLLTLTREESIVTSYKRQASAIRLRIGMDADGRLRAARANLLVDSGAYASVTPLVGWRASMHAAGAYRYEAVHVDTDVVYTNNGYSGAFRGFGNIQAGAAIEQAIDELAERAGIDPIDFRLKNALRPGDRAMTGNVIAHEIGLSACLEWVRAASDWDRKRAEYLPSPPSPLSHKGRGGIRRGIGAACYFHGSSLGAEGADYAGCTVTIENDYGVTLTAGLTDIGQGSRTVYTLIAAEALGVRPARIKVLRPDTETMIESGPTSASRATLVGGNAMRAAGLKLDRLLRWAAADLFHCAPAQVIRDGEHYVGPAEEPARFEAVVDHARALGLTLSASAKWGVPGFKWDFETGAGQPYFCYVFGAQVAEVEVNIDTGETRVLGVWAAHDGGTIIFPQGAAGQMFGGIAQGIGYALMEDIRFDRGYLHDVNFDNYLIPTAADLPDIQGHYVETNFPHGPHGAKNLAEPVMIGAAPAIANALYQATGRRYRHIPVTLERVRLGYDLTRPGSERTCRAALGFGE